MTTILPKILTHTFDNDEALPDLFKNEMEKHFQVIPYDEYLKSPETHDKDIVAILPWFATPKVDSEMIDRMPNLKIVSTISAGYNHLNVPMIRSKNIRVSNTPGVLNESTAEQGITLMLAAARNTIIGAEMAKNEDWPKNFMGTQFSGSTVGIIGMGRIGLSLAKKSIGFGCKIMYNNRRERTDLDIEAEYFANLDEMLPKCDFVCVVCALTSETAQFIKYKHFKLMKKTSIFCNISRGGTVQQDDLLKALEEKEIHMAALDVTSPEPLPKCHPLYQCKNCIIVPHWGSATTQTRLSMVQLAIRNVLQAINNEKELESEVFE